MISVAPYPDANGGLYSLGNRRLFCMNYVYPPSKKVKVYRYHSIQDYDPDWDSKFSTVTQGQSIAVKSKGYKASLGGDVARHIPIPSKFDVDGGRLGNATRMPRQRPETRFILISKGVLHSWRRQLRYFLFLYSGWWRPGEADAKQWRPGEADAKHAEDADAGRPFEE